MTKYRFAIVGCGRIANRHAEQIPRFGELVAVCDVIREKADLFAAKHGSKAYHSLEALLETETLIDVIVICTPNGLHAQQVYLSLTSGKHVLCEKPLTIVAHEASRLIEVANNNRLKLFVVQSARYNSNVVALKSLLARDGLGSLFSFQMNCFWNRPPSYYMDSWKGSATLDGGTLFTQFSHYIDVLLWLFGNVKSISGLRKNYHHEGLIEFEDTGVVSLELENGMIGGLNWSVNSYKKNMEVALTIIAEKGTVQLGGEYMNTVTYQVLQDDQIEDSGAGKMTRNGNHTGSMSNHHKVYENFIDVLENNSNVFSNAYENVNTIELIQNIYRSTSLVKAAVNRLA